MKKERLETFRLERDQTITWTSENVPQAMNKLILETGSTLKLLVDVELVLIEFIVGDHVTIDATGRFGENGKSYKGSRSRRKHGHGPGKSGRNGGKGKPGGNGFDFIVSTNIFEFGRLTINTSGGNGGNGGDGEGGGKGSNASCDGHAGGAGGNGGKGGNGGNGGNPGKALILFSNPKPRGNANIGTDIKWYPNGGYGGLAGKGRSGGRGGNSANCGPKALGKWAHKQKGGNRGKRGKNGVKGRNGTTTPAKKADYLNYHGIPQRSIL